MAPRPRHTRYPHDALPAYLDLNEPRSVPPPGNRHAAHQTDHPNYRSAHRARLSLRTLRVLTTSTTWACSPSTRICRPKLAVVVLDAEFGVCGHDEALSAEAFERDPVELLVVDARVFRGQVVAARDQLGGDGNALPVPADRPRLVSAPPACRRKRAGGEAVGYLGEERECQPGGRAAAARSRWRPRRTRRRVCRCSCRGYGAVSLVAASYTKTSVALLVSPVTRSGPM